MHQEQSKPALAPFHRRVRAVCGIYFSNIIFLVLLLIIVVSAAFFLIVIESYSSRHWHHENIIKSIEEQIADDPSVTNDTDTISITDLKDELQRLQYVSTRRSQKRYNSIAKCQMFVALFMFLTALPIGLFLRSQFSNPRSKMSPGFVLPHLIVGMGMILLLAGLVSFASWHWWGVSPLVGLAIALVYGSMIMVMLHYQTRYWIVLFFVVPAVIHFLPIVSFNTFELLVDGYLPMVTAFLLLYEVILLAFYGWSLAHLSEEQSEYSTLPMWSFQSSLSRTNSLETWLKQNSEKPLLSQNMMDRMFQFFRNRALQGKQLVRMFHWQAAHGGNALITAVVIALITSLCYGILHLIDHGLAKVLREQHQVLLFFLSLICTIALMRSVFAWKDCRFAFESEFIHPMNRTRFVRSLISTHLLESILVMIPLFSGVLFFAVLSSRTVVQIISLCIVLFSYILFTIFLTTWLLSFRSILPAFVLLILSFASSLFISPDFWKIIQQLSHWQQALIPIGCLVVGVLLLNDTERRWMQTEFGR